MRGSRDITYALCYLQEYVLLIANEKDYEEGIGGEGEEGEGRRGRRGGRMEKDRNML